MVIPTVIRWFHLPVRNYTLKGVIRTEWSLACDHQRSIQLNAPLNDHLRAKSVFLRRSIDNNLFGRYTQRLITNNYYSILHWQDLEDNKLYLPIIKSKQKSQFGNHLQFNALNFIKGPFYGHTFAAPRTSKLNHFIFIHHQIGGYRKADWDEREQSGRILGWEESGQDSKRNGTKMQFNKYKI